MTTPPRTPPVRLAFGALFWRAFLIILIFSEVALWTYLRPFVAGKPPGFRIAALILFSPQVIFRAFLITAVATVLVDLYVRFIMRPLLARWYSPRSTAEALGAPVAFRLESREEILDEVPSRMVQGRRCVPGTLIRTDRRLWFSPHAWDLEPWSLRLEHLDTLTTRHPRTRLGTLLIGTPDRLILVDDQNQPTEFILADPTAILDWYPDRTRMQGETEDEAEAYEPSALHLF